MIQPQLDRQRILVPADSSPSARRAFRAALHLARAPEDVIHVFYMPGLYAKRAEDLALASNPFSNGAELASKQFQNWLALEGSEVAVKTLGVIGIPNARIIAEMAVHMESTLIVLVRRKPTFWQYLFGGCPAEELPRIAPCPLHFVDGSGSAEPRCGRPRDKE